MGEDSVGGRSLELGLGRFYFWKRLEFRGSEVSSVRSGTEMKEGRAIEQDRSFPHRIGRCFKSCSFRSEICRL